MAIDVLLPDAVMRCLEGARDQLGGQGINQFRMALNRSKSDLLDHYIRPNLIRADHSYIYIAEDKGGKGSRPNYDPGNTLAATMMPVDDELAVPGRWGLFTNPLAWTPIGAPPGRDSPSNRAINIGFCLYTLEFDKLPLGEQLRAIHGGGLSRTDEVLQSFRDYRGYEVIYGGAKSLHFHFAFDLRHWKHDLASAGNSAYQDNWRADFPDEYLREAHENRWSVIANAFRRGTEITAEPDPQLACWEQNRRLPLAARLVHDDHPFGLPAGSFVRQYVLSSSVRQHIPRRGKAWLHFDGLVRRVGQRPTRRDPESQPRDAGTTNIGDPITNDDQRRFHQFLVENFPKLTLRSGLRYASVEIVSRGPIIHLFNNADDQTASSIIRADHETVLLQGGHDFAGKIFPLGVSPDRLYEAMVERDSASIKQPDHVLDRVFQTEVHDLGSYRRFLSDHVGTAMSAADLVLILGPEGCGKSSAVMSKINWLVDATDMPVFISSPSYAQAAAKMREFAAIHRGTDYLPFEFVSLTELYRRCCPPSERISEIDALDSGRSSWLATIFREQPDVYRQMREYRDGLHAIRERGQVPVLFGVHETIRRYADIGMTRLFYAKSFDESWFDSMAPDARRAYRHALRYESALAHVVFDEVSPADLVSIHGEAIVRWVQQYRHSVRHLDESNKIGRYMALKSYCSRNPRPREGDDGSAGKSDWQVAQEILHAGYTDDDQVSLTTARFPFEDARGIYKDRVGQSYFVRPRGWTKLAPTTLLTTELVPAQIVDALWRMSIEKDPADCREADHDNAIPIDLYRVFRFDRPGLFEDVVQVENHRDAKRQTLPRLVEAYGKQFPGAVVVSDMITGRVNDDLAVTTHLSARGSNELSGRDIVAFYTAPSPGLFGQLAALDARLGIRNTIALWYVDRFNQTSGRNRGFRGQYKRRHIAVMGYRMYKWLAPYLTTWSRYAFPRQRCSLTQGEGVLFTRRK